MKKIIIILFIIFILVSYNINNNNNNNININNNNNNNINNVINSLSGGINIKNKNEIKKTISDVLLSKKSIHKFIGKIKNEKNINFYLIQLEEFKKLKNLDDFINFKNKFGNLSLLIGFVRSNEKNNFIKHGLFIFDLYSSENKDFIKSVKKRFSINSIGIYAIKKDLSIKLGKYFDTVNSKNNLSNIDYNDPIDIAFSKEPINNLIKYCSNFNDNDIKKECNNYVYLYRANNNNRYCDKIKGNYDILFCKGLLKYNK